MIYYLHTVASHGLEKVCSFVNSENTTVVAIWHFTKFKNEKLT